MAFIDDVLATVKNPEDTHALKYLQIDLAQVPFALDPLALRAQQEGVAQRMGYLAEVTAKSLERTGLGNPAPLYALASRLFAHYDAPCYLNPNLPDFGKRIFEKQSDPIADKWHIVGFFTDEEMDGWLRLYLSDEHEKVHTTRRH
ncbi:hypothetical protein HY492_02825 [Candidatus Woesearchaeota archaeon]|nr:hypothetical protein [Candidatus Woesearchaeota archaeon]